MKNTLNKVFITDNILYRAIACYLLVNSICYMWFVYLGIMEVVYVV